MFERPSLVSSCVMKPFKVFRDVSGLFFDHSSGSKVDVVLVSADSQLLAISCSFLWFLPTASSQTWGFTAGSRFSTSILIQSDRSRGPWQAHHVTSWALRGLKRLWLTRKYSPVHGWWSVGPEQVNVIETVWSISWTLIGCLDRLIKNVCLSFGLIFAIMT